MTISTLDHSSKEQAAEKLTGVAEFQTIVLAPHNKEPHKTYLFRFSESDWIQ